MSPGSQEALQNHTSSLTARLKRGDAVPCPFLPVQPGTRLLHPPPVALQVSLPCKFHAEEHFWVVLVILHGLSLQAAPPYIQALPRCPSAPLAKDESLGRDSVFQGVHHPFLTYSTLAEKSYFSLTVTR